MPSYNPKGVRKLIPKGWRRVRHGEFVPSEYKYYNDKLKEFILPYNNCAGNRNDNLGFCKIYRITPK